MLGEAHGHWLVGYALPEGKLEAARGKAALSFYDFKQPINRVTGKAATLKNAHLFGFSGIFFASLHGQCRALVRTGFSTSFCATGFLGNLL